MLKRALIFVIKPHRPKALPCPALSCLRLPRCKLENLPEFGPRKPTVPVLTKHLNQPSTVLTISHAASPCAAIALLIAVEIHREIWVFRPKAPPSQSVDKNIKSPGRSQHRNGDRAGTVLHIRERFADNLRLSTLGKAVLPKTSDRLVSRSTSTSCGIRRCRLRLSLTWSLRHSGAVVSDCWAQALSKSAPLVPPELPSSSPGQVLTSLSCRLRRALLGESD